MKVALLCNIDNSAEIEQLQGYNQVYGFFLRRELDRIGIDCELVRYPGVEKGDFIVNFKHGNPDCVIAISAGAIIGLRENPLLVEDLEGLGVQVYYLTDAITRSIVPWDHAKEAGAYVGMGVDPLLCRPNQDATPTVLFNAWNKTVDNGEWGDLNLVEARSALQKAMKRGVRVLALNCKVDGAENIGRDVYDSDKLGYVKWLEVVSAYSRGWVFLDTTPKIIELGRVEAAACGASLLVPRSGSDWDRNNPIEGLQYLNQTYWSKGRLYEQLMTLCDAKTFSPLASACPVVRYFSWASVARRVVDFLEAQCLGN